MAGSAAGGARRSRLAPYLLIAPGILWLIVFFVVPLITLAQTSVHVTDAPWWDGFHRALTDYGAHFFRSFRYALVATLLAITLGYPLAYVIAFRAGRFKNLLLGLVVLPFFTTFLVRTFAWKTILNDEGPAAWVLRHRPRTYTPRRWARSGRWCCRSPSPASSPAACSPSFPRLVTSSTRNCSAAPISR
jgi:ABC-type spermidine/putrescine transport system permease subunit I